MTAPDHTTKPLKNTLRERGHPYMEFFAITSIDVAVIAALGFV